MGKSKEAPESLLREMTETPALRNQLSLIAEGFRQRADMMLRIFSGSTGRYMLWQSVTYGYPGTKSYDEKFRGYFMIEPVDFPITLALLDKIALERLQKDKSTSFKWLLMTYPSIGNVGKYVVDPSNIGSYSELQPTDPRIVLYANEKEEVAEIMSKIAADPQWEKAEAHRRTIFDSRKLPIPIRGTAAFVDGNGREWQSLNFNALPGTSESQTKSETGM